MAEGRDLSKTYPASAILHPMTDEIDIYHAAAVLMRERGEDAVIEAAMRADALLAKGDMEGRAVWLRIIAAIREMEATEPTGAVH